MTGNMPPLDPETASAIKRTTRGIWQMVIIITLIVAGIYAVRWAYAEYYIATHCTTVLGTRVCQ